MSDSRIQTMVNSIVQHFDRNTTRDEAQEMLRDAKTAVSAHYRREIGADTDQSLPAMAAKHPEFMHSITTRDFGFKVMEQPQYGEVDDYAWEFSQRYTTLEGVTLPDNASFFTSDRKSVSRSEVMKQMEQGGKHLFDIALSNEYVLLDENEKFSVRDIEQRFSTNNEHLPPQSGSRREGNTKIFKSDPRAIVISYMETNGARGHLQVVFHDENGKPIESVAMERRPGESESTMTRQEFKEGERGARYPIGKDDAPYYAYALALTHFANGFSDDAKKNWFDRAQAEEVVKMLRTLGEKDVDQNIEPVMRDILGDAKVLKGNINPVALLPTAFAEAMQSEIDRNKFREQDTGLDKNSAQSSFVDRVMQRGRGSAGMGM